MNILRKESMAGILPLWCVLGLLLLKYGMITARTMVENLMTVFSADKRARPEDLKAIRERIETILKEYSKRLGCSAENEKAKTAFQRSTAGKTYWQWLKTYQRLNRFRTSLPSIPIHDFTEQQRRREWNLGNYDVDLLTLLKRGVGLQWNEKLNRITVRGIGKYRQVHASEVFTDDECGHILETKDYPNLYLYQG
ncbi:MAG: hypothetical protein ACOX2S_02955 [bacterium]